MKHPTAKASVTQLAASIAGQREVPKHVADAHAAVNSGASAGANSNANAGANASSSAGAKPDAKSVRLNLNLAPEVHAAFKSKAAADGKQMTELVLSFIQSYINAK